MADFTEHTISITGLTIKLIKCSDIKISSAFLDFLLCQNNLNTDWVFRYAVNSELQIPYGKVLLETNEYSFFRNHDNKLTCVFFDLKKQKRIYAISVFNEDERNSLITYLPGAEEYFSELSNCFFHSCWEKVMSLYGRIIIHSALIRTSFGGILFSGPSGIGKSTQADLWIEYENAELINGDRTILYSDNKGNWLGSGSPYAGSSKCYKNEQCEVKAIVMLKQSPDCRLRKMNLAESFLKIYQQCTVYSFDKEFVNTVCDIVEHICMSVPVYEYSCDISREAVQILKEELEGC